MFNLQRYPWNRNLIKTVEDNIVFWLKKRIPNSYLIRQIIQGYRTLLVKHHCSFSSSQYFHLQFSAKFRIHLWLDNEIDRKIYITAMQFLSVQNRQQTHGWTLIGSVYNGPGILDAFPIYSALLIFIWGRYLRFYVFCVKICKFPLLFLLHKSESY